MKSYRFNQILNFHPMKRPNFTQISNLINAFSGLFKTTTVAFSIALTLILSLNSAQAQVNCNTIMACNDDVQISLDDDCSMTIDPDMILEAPAYTDEYYDVEAKLPNGTSLPSTVVGTFNGLPVVRPTINSAHIGLTLKVKVSLRGCGNNCWGNASIEDKLAPVISTCPCEERITSIDTLVSGSTPTYQRPFGSICTGGAGGYATSNYTVVQFAVDATGIVDINLGQTNALFNLYSGSFNPAAPCTNLLTMSTRSFSGSLSVGTNYFLVVSTVSMIPPGTVTIINSLDIDSRDGNVKSAVSASICTLVCNGESTFLNQTATNAQNRPVFIDGCGGTLTYKKADFVMPQLCADDYAKIIRREWTATDASGNVSGVKTQFFYLERADLEDVVCPVDFIRSCGLPFATLPNGAPTPAVSGQPSNISCQNIQVYYNDVVFELCGAGIKVFRQWNIIDWCTGEDKVCAQTIKIEDDVRPVITCPADMVSPLDSETVASVLFTKSASCTADWSVIAPIVVYDCSATTWTVAFKKADALGNDPGPSTPFTTVEGDTRVTGTFPNFTIVNLPLGRTWIRYTVTDECGNSTDCFTEVDVVDKTPPTAICEGTTVISLEDSGWAELYAESLDDHSNDNCELGRFEVRRKTTTCPGYASDLTFGPKVNFCCADITPTGSTVTVILRVYDKAGNFNECETTVKVQNKRKPVITCPTNKTLTCGDTRIAGFAANNTTFFDTTFFGKPTVTGVCGNLTVNSRLISNGLNTCGFGTVVREWFVISDPTVFCRQTLTVTAPTFNANNIVFPSDISINSCNIDDATPEVLNSKPIITSTACTQIGISHTDQVFYEVPDACLKILRTWRVIDWCTYNNVSGPIFEKTQVIKLKGTDAPRFTSGCTTRTVNTDPARCDADVTFVATAEDACTDANELKYTWTLDINKNNTIDASGTGSTFTRTLEVGTHRVSFVVTNRCGTSSTCAYDVVIRSTKKPTPVCLGEVVWVIDADGSTEVWASDFNLKSTGACGNDANLRFSFNAAGNQPARTFTCADIPNGQVARIPLKMYVIDAAGNSDFCDVVLILQDSPLTNACTDNAGLLPTVAGRITTEMAEGIDGIEVELVNMVSSTEITDMTKNEGQYRLTGVDVFDPKSIGAYKNSDILNGVSTLDLVLIQRHILGVQAISSPYKLLAADVNNSRSITASDLVNLRKLILGVSTTLDNNTSWRFVPTDYVFADPAFPFDFPSKVNLDSLFEDKANVNFTAIKVGDVNNSALANASSRSTESRSQNALFVADEMSYNTGDEVSYTVKAGDVMEIMGAQFALDYDANVLSFVGVEAGALAITSQHMNLLNTENGTIAVSYDVARGQSIAADANLFTIKFKALRSGNTKEISFNDDVLKAELYETDATIRPLSLQSRTEGQSGIQNVLYQNEPNPFKDYTNISFELAKPSAAIVRVLDVTGKVVFTSSNVYEKGYHVINIASSSLGTSGVYYYHIEAGDFVSTKKMILIE